MLQEKKVLDVQNCQSQCGKKVWKSLFWRKGALEKFRALLAAFSATSQLKRNTWKAIQIWQRLLFQIWQWLIRALMTNAGNVSRPGLRGRGWSCCAIWTENLCLLFNKNLCVHRLPCKVDRLEGFVMLWKKDANIITVGEQIIDKVRTKYAYNTSCREK